MSACDTEAFQDRLLRHNRNHNRFIWFFVALILLSDFALRLIHLGHESIKPLDEVFHAIVARSLLSHPLQPTLNQTDFLQTLSTNWQNAHIWLHKPPLALWQIALSYSVLGTNNFALRFPSALQATLAALLTFLIGRRLFDSTTAVIAMSLQAFNPVLEMLVHGYVFSDHVDTALLFWSELSVLLLLQLKQTGHRRDALLCGLAQGAAFMAKTFPGLITTALAMALLFLSRNNVQWRRLSLANLAWIIFGTLLAAAPWNVYAYVNWPNEYLAQTLGILQHLNRDVEGWAGPWDRLMVDYGWRVVHVFYPLAIVAIFLAASYAIRMRDRRIAFVLLWLLFALAPNVFATSKPMTATLVGWPAVWLLMGWLIDRALYGDLRAGFGLLLASLGYALLCWQPMPTAGWGYVRGHPLAGVLLENWQPVAIGIGASLCALAVSASRRHGWVTYASAIAVLIMFACPLGPGQPHGYLRDFWRVSQIRSVDPVEPELVAAVRQLPPNCVVLLQTRVALEDKLLQWKTGRDCWPLQPEQQLAMIQQITARGGRVYLVTAEPVHLPDALAMMPSGRRLYAVNDNKP